MIALFALIAFASAVEYIIADDKLSARVKVIDQCFTHKKDEAEESEKYIKVNATHYKSCTYKQGNCGGTGECGDIPLGQGEKYVTELPDYAYKKITDRHSSKCTYANAIVDYEIFKTAPPPKK